MRCKNPNCKDKFKPRYFLQKFCLEKEECIALEVQLKKDTIWKDKRKEWEVDVYAKERKKDLQDEINTLARKIDAVFGYDCIDCGKPFEEHQIDACHLISRGSNSTLKYHLHNLHSGHNHCNFYNPTHESNYKKGLIKRYGSEYLEEVEALPQKYPELRLSNREITEKLALVRKINRTFHTYTFIDGRSARTLFNKLIGIYN